LFGSMDKGGILMDGREGKGRRLEKIF